MEKSRKPKIRFKGFTDDWEQRKLEEILIQRIQHQKITSNVPLLAFSYAEGVIDPNDKKTNKRDFIMTDKYNKIFSKTEKNDIIYNPANVIHGAIHRNKLGIGVVSPIYKIFICQNINPKFLGERLHTDEFIAEIAKYIEGSVIKLRTLSPEQFLDMSIEVPSSRIEQEKIGSMFENLDNLITLHQRKLEKLMNVKKSMLEKMFPKQGSKVPEIRFNGFTDDWEQRKLEDYITVSIEKNTGNIYGRSDVLSVSGDYGIVNQIEFQGRSFAGASVSNYGVVQTGDIVYTKSPLNSNPYGIIKTNKGKTGIVSTLYAVYHPKENVFSDFVQLYFEQHARMNNYMHPLVNKGAKNDMKVSAENALKGPVCFPLYIEQESISAFFSVLDNLITLHQRKLEKLKNIKKSMLEKMFI